MLLQFTIENFLSFRDRTVLSMLADPRVAHGPEQTRATATFQALRLIGIYGANGSGKSNLARAFSTVRKMVVDGTTREDERIPITPFKLDAEHRHAPVHVEIDFTLDGFHYSYGFETTARTIQAEWLHRVDAVGETPLFTRDAAKGASIVIGALSGDSERLGFLRYAAIGTRENQLFLAEAGQREIPELDRFRDYFRKWVVTGPHTSYGPLLTRLDDDEPFRTSTAQLLADAGTGVAGLRISKTPLKVEAPTDINAFREALGDPTTSIRAIDDNQVEILNLWATHTSPHSPPTELNLREESDGTQRLLHLAPLLHDLDQEHTLCVVDELDRSLHPLLTRLFLQRFLTRSQQGTGQLIFTTHDTNILDFNLLSRDSVGFVEKDVSGRSITYPLSELNQAQVDEVEKHGLEAAYLDGRFGAIPFLGIRKRI